MPRSFIPLFAIGLLACSLSQAAEPAADAVQFFEQRVRPVLLDRCSECHQAESPESGLAVDSLAGLLRGGERGPAIVPGKPRESLLILAINHADQLHMPPKLKIPQREIADLTRWVETGAVWPNAKPVESETSGESIGPAKFSDAQREFWAFQPVRAVDLPPVKQPAWVRSPSDHFVLARLEAAGLKPAPPADRRTLIRRATYDLTGLPPSIAEIEAYLADRHPGAFARVIDRLLASPRYGEHWGRQWLDVARYADSNGLDENLAYANAFRYRDYVINAFNRDKPYDRFVTEQLAGDLLPDEEPGLDERITATGFLMLGAKMLAEDDPVKMQMDIVDEQVDTMGRAFMGLTLGCARCHDHKFDPIPTADYYALAGIFKSTKTMENFQVVARWQERPVGDREMLRQQETVRQQVNEQQAAVDSMREMARQTVRQAARRRAHDYFRAAAGQQQLIRRLDQIVAEKQGIVIEAESFARGNVSRLHDGYGEGIGVIIGAAGKNLAEYDVQVDRAGSYDLAIRYAAAAARPTQLYLNDKLIRADVAAGVTGSWYPDTQSWVVETRLTLDSGKSVLRLQRAQPFPHFDKLVLVPSEAGPMAPDQKANNPNATEPGESKPQIGGAKLIPAWVVLWADRLKPNEEDRRSFFAPWHAWHAGRDWSELTESPAREIVKRLGKRPASASQLVDRYVELLAESVREEHESPASSREQAGDAELDATAVLRKAIGELLSDPKGPFATLPIAQIEPYFLEEQRAQLAIQEQELATGKARLRPLPEVMAVSDGEPENLRIHIRGSHISLGPEVPRRFLQILAGAQQSSIGDKQSGRLQLARWLTHKDHPLTARVIVNRVWQGHFGRALVRSPDNFGRLGERPTHPELLDHLALTLQRDGWSLKRLHRRIMLSAAYRMSTRFDPDHAETDPDNRLLWRMNRRRLSAESIRDTILVLGEGLDERMGGTQLPTKNRAYVTSTANVNPKVYDGNRRSVYLPVVRSALYEVFQAFDFADPSVPSGKRQSTTVAPQALFMMNSPLVSAQTKAMATRLLAADYPSDVERVAAAFEQAYGRRPQPRETEQAMRFLARQSPPTSEPTNGSAENVDSQRVQTWQRFCRALLSANPFLFVD